MKTTPSKAATRRNIVAATRRTYLAATRRMHSAAKRRYVVAPGVSPGYRRDTMRLSPGGTTCDEPTDGHIAPLGLRNRWGFVDHGLAPMATTCCPFGTETQVVEFAESAKLEKAIQANLRGLSYGG